VILIYRTIFPIDHPLLLTQERSYDKSVSPILNVKIDLSYDLSYRSTSSSDTGSVVNLYKSVKELLLSLADKQFKKAIVIVATCNRIADILESQLRGSSDNHYHYLEYDIHRIIYNITESSFSSFTATMTGEDLNCTTLIQINNSSGLAYVVEFSWS